MSIPANSVFGKAHLGHVVIETQKFGDWKRFGRDAIGMHLDELSPDTARFRLDDNACRVLLRRGPAEDVVALGWHLDGAATFDEVSRRVADAAVPAAEGGEEEAEAARRGAFLAVPRPQRARPGDLHQRPHRAAGPGHARVAGSSPAQAEWAMSP